jgi:hypothetical protein
MRLLDLPQAKHYCTPPAQARTGIGRQSLPTYYTGLAPHIVVMQEGSTAFQIHQVNVLDSVERWLAYAVAHYRRSIEMLVPVSAPWMHVTLYYSSFFAANAILGMFGGWIGHTARGIRAVDVEAGAPGNQALRVHRQLRSPRGAKGSHKIFWDVFYDATAAIVAWAPAELAPALSPVNGSYDWQIGERNNVNYDMFHAWAASKAFYASFNPARLKSLSGPLQLQLEATQTILQLALHFATEVTLQSDALLDCGFEGKRLQIQRRLVKHAPPHLLSQSALDELLEV